MHKPNNILEHDVKAELDWDPLLDADQIVVKADAGVVTLSGAVPTYYDWALASDDALSVGGVTYVDNEIMVGLVGEAVADADVAVACGDALDADKLVPKGAVSVQVVDGWVTLSGTVRRHFQRQAAKRAVSKVDWVRGVTDYIVLSGDPIPSDVAARINDALARNALIDDSLIEVTSSGHTIYLDGTTSSWASRAEAEDTAWEAPGVTDVVEPAIELLA
ncbi:MAG: BON domain-containing protein [Acidimicrobiales bacterium]|jgi:osmotically-inducible protein OsmY